MGEVARTSQEAGPKLTPCGRRPGDARRPQAQGNLARPSNDPLARRARPRRDATESGLGRAAPAPPVSACPPTARAHHQQKLLLSKPERSAVGAKVHTDACPFGPEGARAGRRRACVPRFPAPRSPSAGPGVGLGVTFNKDRNLGVRPRPLANPPFPGPAPSPSRLSPHPSPERAAGGR